MSEIQMPTFTIGQSGFISGIPTDGDKIRFESGDTYTPKDGQELAELMKRPDFVAAEVPQGDGTLASGVINVPPTEQEEPPELEVAQAKRAFKDELIITPQNTLWEREFPDGTAYRTVWKHGLKKVEFVENIMEKVYSET